MADKFTFNYSYEIKIGIAVSFLVLGNIHAQEQPQSTSVVVTQTTEISGVVSDEQGNPIPNAKIFNKTQKSTVYADEKGNFRIYANIGDEIQISHLGYFIFKQVIMDNAPLYASLKSAKENEKEIETLVITGYQKIDATRAAASVDKVSVKNFEKRGATDIVSGMEGLSPSLIISNNPSDPTGSKELTIRGVATLAGSSQPLIVVDGFQYEGDLKSINPYEIESITLLKDAASASIYGAKSANGIIVVTTKKGKTGGTQVRYTSNLTIKNKADINYLLNRVSSNELVNIQELLAKEALDAAQTSNTAESEALSLVNYKHRFDNNIHPQYAIDNSNRVYYLYSQLYYGQISQSEFDAQLALLRTLDNTNDLKKNYLQSPFINQQNISLMGGNSGFRYRTSLNYTDELGNIKNSKNNRILFDFVSDIRLSPRINFDFQANFTVNRNEHTPLDWNGDVARFSQIKNISSYDTFYNPDGSVRTVFMPYFNSNYNGLFGGKDPYEIERLKSLGLLDETYYPATDFGQYSYTNKNWSTRLQGLFSYKVTNDLTLKFGGQVQKSAGNIRDLAKANSWYMRQLINNTTPLTYTGDRRELNIPIGAILKETRNETTSYLLRAQADYSKTFGEHHISALLGTEIQNVESEGTITDRFGYDEISNIFLPINNQILSQNLTGLYIPEGGRISNGLNFGNAFAKVVDRYFSLYANVNYSLKNKYIFTGSIRTDESNLFGTDPKYRYIPFWSVGAKWRVGEEAFLKDKNITLDLRASYGINGNKLNNIGPFDIAKKAYIYRAGNNPSLVLTSYKVNDLRWERTQTTNLGFDTKLFNSRVNLSFDYYHKNSKDVLSNIEIDPTLGTPIVMKNDANIINKGYEVQLSTRNIEKDNFSWDTQVNFRLNKGNVKKVFFNTASVSALNYAGIPMNIISYEPNSLFVFDFAGLDNEGYALIRKENGTLVSINETINTRSLSVNDLKYAGTLAPKYVVGLNNNISYKNFSLSFSFIYQGGHKLLKDSYNGDYIYNRRISGFNSDAARAWKNTGDEAHTDIPKVNSALYADFVQKSSKNVISGDFIRLRDIILSYTLPRKYTDALKVRELTFNVRAGNVWLWTKNKEGIDPETQGLGYRTLPLQKSFSFGINLIF